MQRGRDLRLPRLERLRQDHDDEDADRPAAAPARARPACSATPVDAARHRDGRRRVGYMSQAFSLYSELTVRQNLELHARLFQLPAPRSPARIAEMVAPLRPRPASMDALPDALPLGIRQRLSLAVAMVHGPEILILDEPTSGVDPVARDSFWQILVDLSRKDDVTIFISTHFMNEAERCDRISLMHAGKVLVSDTPAGIVAARGAANLEEAFVALSGRCDSARRRLSPACREARCGHRIAGHATAKPIRRGAASIWRGCCAYTRREALELQARSDPRHARRRSAACMLMFVHRLRHQHGRRGPDLRGARPRRQLDQPRLRAPASRARAISPRSRRSPTMPISTGGCAPARSASPSRCRRASAATSARGRNVEIGAWIDGANAARAPKRCAATCTGLHAHLAAQQGPRALWRTPPRSRASTARNLRYRYNPDVSSVVAMVPAIIPLLLMMIPAMLAALSVVREKELGSIVNLLRHAGHALRSSCSASSCPMSCSPC